MWIIGVDYHPSVQQIAFVNTDTGECGERRLNHSDGEAEKFYRELKAAGCRVRVGMEATGHARWFERLLAKLGLELWIDDPAKSKAKRVRKAEDGPPGCRAEAAAAQATEPLDVGTHRLSRTRANLVDLAGRPDKRRCLCQISRKGLGVSQLAKQHGDKLSPTREPSGMVFRFVLTHCRLKFQA